MTVRTPTPAQESRSATASQKLSGPPALYQAAAYQQEAGSPSVSAILATSPYPSLATPAVARSAYVRLASMKSPILRTFVTTSLCMDGTPLPVNHGFQYVRLVSNPSEVSSSRRNMKKDLSEYLRARSFGSQLTTSSFSISRSRGTS